ncbi:MAG: hypothetical protein CMJ83_05740 [Planctomycetes bacterium]|nr:hypothetical protein [Planctomycetota bacterium]
MTRSFAVLLALVLLTGGCGRPADEPRPSASEGSSPANGQTASGDWRAEAAAAVTRGVAALEKMSADGKWLADPKGKPDLGVTALATRAVIGTGGQSAAKWRSALDWLAAAQKDDGGIYDQGLKTYITSAAVMAFVASKVPYYQKNIDQAAGFLAMIQSDEGDGLDESSEDYGGVGYGGSGVVNLSTTQFAVDAADEAGLAKDHKFYSKALKFLERSHNHSESNDHQTKLPDGTVVVPGNDGGGIYRPSDSKAGTHKLDDGRTVFRSYGSMTYALLKSYLLCNLDARDARVKSALKWIGDNWQLEYNPGMEWVEKREARYMGLYYYYLTIVRCLDIAERQKVKLDAAALQGWRGKVARAILDRQREDGSWINHQDRWFEGIPALATAYSVIALQVCLDER